MKNSYIKQNSGSGTKTPAMTKRATTKQDDAAEKWIADAQLSSQPSSLRWSRSSSMKKKSMEQLYVLEDGYLLGASPPSKEARGGVEEERFDDKDSIVTEIVKNTKSNDNDSTSSETIRTEIVNNSNIFDDAISVLTEPFGGFVSKAETIKYEPPTPETISDTSTKKDTTRTKKTPSLLLKTKAKVISAQKERQTRKEKVLADMKELKKQKEIEKKLKIEKDRAIQMKKTADRVKREVQAAEKIKSTKKKQSKKLKQKTLIRLPTVEESRTEVEDTNVDIEVKRDDTIRQGISDKDIADAEIFGLKEELSALKSMLSKIQRTENVAVHQSQDVPQVNKNLKEEVNMLREVLSQLVSNQSIMILQLQGQAGINQLSDINVSTLDPSSKSNQKRGSDAENGEASTSNLFQWIMSCGGGESAPTKQEQESECDSSYAASTSTMSNSLASEDTGGHMSTDSDMNPEWFVA